MSRGETRIGEDVEADLLLTPERLSDGRVLVRVERRFGQGAAGELVAGREQVRGAEQAADVIGAIRPSHQALA
ncbi:MAG: hypothetical protein JO057_03890 [Chloroflexi bacterium]|nr:hypothetical protein [Chloroflexota bacterium]